MLRPCQYSAPRAPRETFWLLSNTCWTTRGTRSHPNGRRTVYLPTLRCKAALGQIAAKINKSSAMNTAGYYQIIQLFDQAFVLPNLPQAGCALCGLKSPVEKINMRIERCLICQRASLK
jgi:hypothetical protein